MDPLKALGNAEEQALMEVTPPAYSNLTMLRAFLMWLGTGQTYDFKYFCGYFHYLKALKQPVPSDKLLKSKVVEFNLLSNKPPNSLLHTYPHLDEENKNTKESNNNENSLENNVFDLEGYQDLKMDKGVTAKEIVETSDIIRSYCNEYLKTLTDLLMEYQDYSKKCELEESVNNISVYIKKQKLKDDLVLYNNLKNFSF